MLYLLGKWCASITTSAGNDKGAVKRWKERIALMSETQVAAIARLEARLGTLKERL
jgi:hypothetical protein